MKKLWNISIGLFIITIFSSCEGDYNISMKNNSPYTIHVYCKEKSAKFDTVDFKGTMKYVPPISQNQEDFVYGMFGGMWLKWEDHIGVLSVYIIHKDSLEKYGEDVLSDKNRYILYEVTGKQLDEFDSKLYFPPTPSMKDVVMYPSYDEIIRKVNDE